MTQLKHTIIFLIVLLIIFLGISYLISLNIEIGFWVINSQFISNNFLFTCFSGAFASILVILATEIYRFVQIKKSIEQFLFTQLAFIYGQLQITWTCIDNLLSKNELIPENLLFLLSDTIKQVTPSLRSLDYNTFISTNKSRIIGSIVFRLITTEISYMVELSHDCLYLPIAINTDKLDLLNEGNYNPVITSRSPNTHKFLQVLHKDISRLKTIISIDITELNAVCDNRFHWNVIERKISSITKKENSFATFISKYKTSNKETNE